MRKTYLKFALLAVLAAGATMVTSCEKEENEVSTSNVETKIGDPEFAVDPENPGTFDVAVGTVLWWHYRIEKDEQGNYVFVKHCLPIIPLVEKPQICMMRVEPNIEDFTEGDVVADLDGKDGFVLRLKLTISQTNAELYETFKILAEEGLIEFEEDIEIEDPENLLSLKESYIPAGKYPIKFIDDKFVITINE